MISASDVPACPACGSREVHPVTQASGPTLYACRQCGRDQTDAWEAVQPAPPAVPVIGKPQETIREAAMRLGRQRAEAPDPLPLGIGAELKT